MKSKFLLIFMFVFTLILYQVQPAWAQETLPLTLDRCISIALKKNPLIQSYNHRYRASQARTSHAYAFPQPAISLDYDLQPNAFNFKGSDEQYIANWWNFPAGEY
jgi:outer membrane protein TolC